MSFTTVFYAKKVAGECPECGAEEGREEEANETVICGNCGNYFTIADWEDLNTYVEEDLSYLLEDL